jgi:hypothetical protein
MFLLNDGRSLTDAGSSEAGHQRQRNCHTDSNPGDFRERMIELVEAYRWDDIGARMT